MKSLLSEKVYLQLIQRHFSREDLDGTDYEQVFDIFVLAEIYDVFICVPVIEHIHCVVVVDQERHKTVAV